MAGLGETCTHIAAVLFYIEAVARVQEQQTSTQSACHWIIPAFQKSVEYHPVQDIDFTSPAKKKKRIEDAIAIISSTELSSYEETVATPKPNTQKKTMKCPSSSDMDRMYQMLSKGTNTPAILSLITPYSNMYVPRTTHTGLPPVLQLLYNPDYMKLTYDELLSKSESININISAEMASRLEAETKSQHKSKMWFRFRAGRVTASKMKAACHTDVANPSISLLNFICYPEVFSFSSKQTSWEISMKRME